VFWHFYRREIESRYLGSLSGLAWALLHPALQLVLYATVFQQIFKARIAGAEEHGFVAYVGVGFWAWTLFAEGTSRAVNVFIENAALIGKVAVPPHWLVGASVAATVSLHLFGYAVALLILALVGTKLVPVGVLLAIPVFASLIVLTLGLALILASVQVFIRDLGQVWGQLVTFWFFLTPVLYSREMLPEFARGLMAWNPISYYPERLRSLILEGELAPTVADAQAWAVATAALTVGWLLFQRLRRHLEDFL
jgi:ABC-type polysaccharide/polyol phosphate export permease